MPFEKGKSGNPKGRPKGVKLFSSSLRKVLESDRAVVILTTTSFNKEGEKEMKTETIDIKTSGGINHALSVVLANEGLKGNIQALKEIANRMDGKAHQSFDFTERKPDDLEDMSVTELNNEALDLMTQMEKKLDRRPPASEKD